MNWLAELTREKIEKGPLPLKELLENSLYYPSSGFDGGVVKDCNTVGSDHQITSFIYCDYAVGEQAFLDQRDSFLGYACIGNRRVFLNELLSSTWIPSLPPTLNRKEYSQYKDTWNPFVQWAVFERQVSRDRNHGPDRFSLLYLGGEGVASYQALYWGNKQRPKALAIIQPGHAFGLNWTDYTEQGSPLHWVVKNNPAGAPTILYYGGYGRNYSDFSWSEYSPQRKISPYYYPEYGSVTVYELNGPSKGLQV
jgi:hypothetical protein